MEEHQFAAIQRDLGALIKGQESMDSHIRAVSANTKATDDKLDKHMLSNTEHGASSIDTLEKRNSRRLGDWIAMGGIAISLVTLGLVLMRGH